MTGEVLIKELLQIREDISVILMTGDKNFSVDEEEDIGIKRILTKPYKMEEIINTINRVLDLCQRENLKYG